MLVPRNLSDHSQLLHYLSVQLRYRLDLSFVYGLHARYQDYRIAFLSPSRVAHSANFSWERLDALAHYVAVVYRHEQTAHDEFNQVEGTNCSWTIEVDNKTYIGEQFFASFPLGRTTVSLIVVDMSGEHDLLFLKTYYVNSTSRFREEQLYKVAHGNYEKSGYIQGLALLVSAKEYANKYQLHGGSMGVPRTKCVVVLGSIGKPLSTCRSVLSLLKVIYDATVSECHRYLYSLSCLLIVSISVSSTGGNGEKWGHAPRYQPGQYHVQCNGCQQVTWRESAI